MLGIVTRIYYNESSKAADASVHMQLSLRSSNIHSTAKTQGLYTDKAPRAFNYAEHYQCIVYSSVH